MEQILAALLMGMLVVAAFVFIRNERLSAKRIKNLEAHRLASNEYIMVTFRFEGEEVVIMMTQNEFNKARKRAESNPEDVWKNK